MARPTPDIVRQIEREVRRVAEGARQDAARDLADRERAMDRDEDEIHALKERLKRAHEVAMYERTTEAQKVALGVNRELSERAEDVMRHRQGQAPDKAMIAQLKKMKKSIADVAPEHAMQPYAQHLLDLGIQSRSGKGPVRGANAASMQRAYRRGMTRRIQQLDAAERQGIVLVGRAPESPTGFSGGGGGSPRKKGGNGRR